ncbi:hypothetical protein LCGC14_2347690, partial [marine sediment metagenome]
SIMIFSSANGRHHLPERPLALTVKCMALLCLWLGAIILRLHGLDQEPLISDSGAAGLLASGANQKIPCARLLAYSAPIMLETIGTQAQPFMRMGRNANSGNARSVAR